MARMPELEVICAEHGLKMCSVDQIIEHRLGREKLLTRLEPASGAPIETPHGTFTLFAYKSAIDPLPHIALTAGGIGTNGSVTEDPVLVRVHRRDLLGDIFDELTNPTGEQLRRSMELIQEAGRGVLVYLRPEGVGDDLRERLQQISRPGGHDVNVPDLTRADGVAGRAHPMQFREVGVGSQILRDLGLRRLRVLTNNPTTYGGLGGFGLEIVEQLPIDR